MIKAVQRKSTRRSGSAVVELAVALPVLLVLILGIWEVGRIIEVTQVLSNAAREGARRASTASLTATQAENVVINYLNLAGFNTTGCKVKVFNITQNPAPDYTGPSDNPMLANQMDIFEVTVELPFDNVKWAFVNQITNTTNLKARAEWPCTKDQPLTIDTTLPNN